MKTQPMPGRRTSGSLPRLAALLAALAFVPVLNVQAIALVCDDSNDSDLDKLSDCAEVNILGTLPDDSDTDADGVSDQKDLEPVTPGNQNIPVELSLAALNREDVCEWRDGNRWDPFLSTAFVKLPLTSGDVIHTFSKTGTGFDSRGTHTDERPNGPISTPPTVTVNVPSDFSKIRVPSLGAYPFLNLNIGLTEHDAGTSGADDAIRLMPNANVLVDNQLPIAVDTVGQSVALTYTGSGSSCDGKLVVEVSSPIEWPQVVKAVLASTKGSGQYVTASDLQNKLGSSSSCSAEFLQADGTGGVVTGRVCTDTPSVPSSVATGAATDEADATADMPLALADPTDTDSPLTHKGVDITSLTFSGAAPSSPVGPLVWGALFAPFDAGVHESATPVHDHGTHDHGVNGPATAASEASILYGLAEGNSLPGESAIAAYRVVAPDGLVLDEARVRGQSLAALSVGAYEALPGTAANWPAGSTIELTLETEDGSVRVSQAQLPTYGTGDGLVFLELDVLTGQLAATGTWTDLPAVLASLEP